MAEIDTSYWDDAGLEAPEVAVWGSELAELDGWHGFEPLRVERKNGGMLRVSKRCDESIIERVDLTSDLIGSQLLALFLRVIREDGVSAHVHHGHRSVQILVSEGYPDCLRVKSGRKIHVVREHLGVAVFEAWKQYSVERGVRDEDC